MTWEHILIWFQPKIFYQDEKSSKIGSRVTPQREISIDLVVKMDFPPTDRDRRNKNSH